MGVSPGLYTRFPEWLVPEPHRHRRTEATTQTRPNRGFIAEHWAFPICLDHGGLFFRHKHLFGLCTLSCDKYIPRMVSKEKQLLPARELGAAARLGL